MSVRIMAGDALSPETWAPIPSNSVHCVVTSPPYWGLRDYGVDGQIGLEPTPDAWAARLVGVFREVRRVLRPDGVVFINLGDSYASGDVARRGVLPSGTACTEPQDWSGLGYACPDLCDGCAAVLLNRSAHSGQPRLGSFERHSTIGRDRSRQDCGEASLAVELPAALASTIPGSSGQSPGGCSHCCNCGACLDVLRSPERDARLCVRTDSSGDTRHIAPSVPPSAARNGSDLSSVAWPYSSTARLKGKDLIGQPWLLAFALRADGWWLRSDIQWSKPNPMPESVDGWRWEPHRVRDPETGKLVECPGCPKCEPNDGLVLSKGSWRPTKAHEVVFMLAKSESYFCDAEAVRGPDAGLPSGNGFAGRQGGERATAIKGGVGSVERFQPGVGRNARS